MAIRLRRPLALASVVTATLAGAVVLRSLTSGGGDPAPPASLTAAASPTLTVSSTTSPAQAPALAEVAPVLTKRVFAAGEQVTVKDGIGFLSAADGSLETWSFPGSENSYYSLQSSPDGALLVFNQGKEGSLNVVVDRSSGRSWQLSRGLGVQSGAGHGAFFVATFSGPGAAPAYFVASAADGSLRPLPITGETGAFGLTSPDGRKVALWAGDGLYLVDLAAASATRLATGIDRNSASAGTLPGALGFTLSQNGAPIRRWFTWEGAETPGGLAPGAVSPNGRYLAAEWSAGPIKSGGEGGYPAIGSVSIIDRTPNIQVARYLGASTVGSRFGDAAWTSSSDSLVIEVAAGYKLVSPSGQVLSSIDDAIHVLSPRPSPTIAGLLGTNRGTIINTARNQTVAPNYAVLPWYADWTTKPGELSVQLATPGKGRGWLDQVFPFEARTNAAASPPMAAVKADGDCLNLRERPTSTGTVVRCSPDGSLLAFDPANDPAPDPKTDGTPPMKYAGVSGADGTIWLHLKAADGVSGWADAKYIGWAK